MIGATLCSGIGAPECAAPWIDWRWHAEIEAFPAAVHAHRFPGSINLGDMAAPDLVERAARIALPDVIVAGTPCQGFSIAGLRASLSDARGNLTLTFVRICNAIDDLRRAAGLPPLWVVWENVPGVLSVGDNAFGSFLAGMVGGDAALEPPRGRGWTDAGVVSGPRRCAAWRVLDAQHFGLAQRRRRVFVLARGGAGSWAAADAILPVIESVRWHPAPRREAGQGPAAGALRSSDGGSDVDHARAEPLIPSTGYVSHYLNAGGMGRQDYETETLVAHALRAEGFDASEDGTGRGTPLVPVSVALRGRDEGGAIEIGDDRAFTLRASSGGGDKPHVFARAFNWQSGGDARGLDLRETSQLQRCQVPAILFSSNDYGADAGDLAPTMRAMGHSKSHANAGGQIATAQTAAVRRLTPREAERLQGFPDDWTLVDWRGKPAADGPRYKALGNSMAVPVMRYLLQRITEVDGGR